MKMFKERPHRRVILNFCFQMDHNHHDLACTIVHLGGRAETRVSRVQESGLQ